MYMYICIYMYTYANVSVLFCCSSPLYLIPQHIATLFLSRLYILIVYVWQILSKLLVWDSQKIRAGADQHPFKWLLDADRRLHHCLGSERENFESSLSGTAVSAPSDIWKVCGSILCICSNVKGNTGVCIYALISQTLLFFLCYEQRLIFLLTGIEPWVATWTGSLVDVTFITSQEIVQ